MLDHLDQLGKLSGGGAIDPRMAGALKAIPALVRPLVKYSSEKTLLDALRYARQMADTLLAAAEGAEHERPDAGAEPGTGTDAAPAR